MANLRCYSCAPCTEFDYSSGWRDPGRWEMDCPLDRYCFKITGQVSIHWPSCCIPPCIVLISIIIYYFWILCPSMTNTKSTRERDLKIKTGKHWGYYIEADLKLLYKG